MFDHLTLTVSNLQASAEFYSKALGPLGFTKQRDYGEILAFGPEGKPAFWIKAGPAPQSAMHLAFRARERSSVDGFHAEALKAGGKDDGAPGLREHYHPHYYGAFVIDPDGHHIEAVCHVQVGQQAAVARAKPAKTKAMRAVKKPAKKAAKKKKKR